MMFWIKVHMIDLFQFTEFRWVMNVGFGVFSSTEVRQC